MESVDYQPLSVSQNSVNTQECFLQGSIFDSCVEQLNERLRGLCDNVPAEQVVDNERNYLLKAGNNAPIHVKVCRTIAKNNVPLQLKYVGATDGNRNKSTMTRSTVTVACNKGPDDFLKELGFQVQYDVQLRGKLYRKGNIKIIVAKILSKFDQNKYKAASSSHLVEISAPATARDETVSSELKIFAQSLRPIVHLDKVDNKKMQQAFQV